MAWGQLWVNGRSRSHRKAFNKGINLAKTRDKVRKGRYGGWEESASTRFLGGVGGRAGGTAWQYRGLTRVPPMSLSYYPFIKILYLREDHLMKAIG